MSDTAWYCDTCGRDVPMSNEIGDAEHRVAEAALKLEFFRNELEAWPLVGPDALPEFEAAVDDLRRLKGEG